MKQHHKPKEISGRWGGVNPCEQMCVRGPVLQGTRCAVSPHTHRQPRVLQGDQQAMPDAINPSEPREPSLCSPFRLRCWPSSFVFPGPESSPAMKSAVKMPAWQQLTLSLGRQRIVDDLVSGCQVVTREDGKTREVLSSAVGRPGRRPQMPEGG